MGIIGLKEADCRSCYRCLKVCPVKSIKFTDEQARILDADCLLCAAASMSVRRELRPCTVIFPRFSGRLKWGAR